VRLPVGRTRVPGSSPAGPTEPGPAPLREAAARPLLHEPAFWVAATLVLYVSGCTIWLAFGPGAPPFAAQAAGISTIPGAIVTACFAVCVRRRLILTDGPARMGAVVVLALALYWVSTLLTSSGPAPNSLGPVDTAFNIANVAVYALVGVGFVSVSRASFDRAAYVTFGLDLAIVSWAAALVLWQILLYPIGSAAGANLFTIFILASSPAVDIGMVVLAAAVARRPVRGLSTSAVWILVVAFVWCFAADLAYVTDRLAGHGIGLAADLFRSWFWVSAAIVLVLLLRNRPAVEDDREISPPSFAWLPYLAVAVAFILPPAASWQDITRLRQNVPASILLLGLALARLAFTARQNARLAATAEANRTEARFHALVQHASDVVALGDLDSRLRYVSPAAASMLGTNPEMMIGRRLTELLPPEDVPMATEELASIAARGRSTSRAQWRLRRSDGSYCETETTIANMSDVPNVGGIVFTIRDISERSTLERALAFQALHDPLTGLANRTLFIDRVEHALAKCNRRRGAVAVLFIDLDDFKKINDAHGHGIGDNLLAAAAERLGARLRSGDTAARLGGDEFAVLLEEIHDEEVAREIASRIVVSLQQPFILGDVEACISASVGIAMGAAGELSRGELLRNADLAMYVAKANGKRRCEMFQPSMHEGMRTRLELELELRHAVERRELEVHYQPVWETATRRTVGVEALVRWRHPRNGLIGPGSFIALAEETGLVVEIGGFVLREACAQITAWDREGGACAGLSLAVNLSSRQLREPDLVEVVAAALSAAGLAPGRLNLEITESGLVDESLAILQLLQRLKSLGVRISIDDFGTGYSSLSYLRRLPVDTLKIAKPFVDVLTHDAKDEALARAVVSLARILDLDVVAEGIEVDAQLDALLAMGCPLGQGFLVARPVPAAMLRDAVIGGRKSRAAA